MFVSNGINFTGNIRERARIGDFSISRISQLTLRFFVLLAMIAILLGATKGRAQSTQDEYRVKAAFLFHFAQLVSWPPNVPGDASNSFVLCTVGEDPFQGDLESTMAQKKIGSRMIHIRHVRSEQIRECTMLFVGQDEGASLKDLLASLGNAPILTVGETDDFLDAGGMIQFLMEGNKIRFSINRRAAEQAHLTISSQLLLLAQKVIEPSEASKK